jgi:hypothetical protein
MSSVSVSTSERLVGRDVQPKVGMVVKLTVQALERRAECSRADHSKGGTGIIVKVLHCASTEQHLGKAAKGTSVQIEHDRLQVHPNWTCDVQWSASKRIRSGYACGTAAGKVISPSFEFSFICTISSYMGRFKFNLTFENGTFRSELFIWQ